MFADGSQYHGEWQHGAKHGNGYSLWPRERHYGEYVSGQRHGYGTAVFNDGGRYEGDYQMGKLTGHCTHFFSNGNVYLGQYVDGRPQGRGVFFWGLGDCYDGTFVDGQRQKCGGLYFHAGGAVEVSLADGDSVGWSGNGERYWHSAGDDVTHGTGFEEVVDVCGQGGGPSRMRLTTALAGPPNTPVPKADVSESEGK